MVAIVADLREQLRSGPIQDLKPKNSKKAKIYNSKNQYRYVRVQYMWESTVHEQEANQILTLNKNYYQLPVKWSKIKKCSVFIGTGYVRPQKTKNESTVLVNENNLCKQQTRNTF